MPDPVQLPVSLQPGQNARSAAPLAIAAPERGADAPFARSLARLLQSASGLPSGPDTAAGGGTDLPLPDQILPPDARPGDGPSGWPPGRETEGEGGLALALATDRPMLSGQDRPADTMSRDGGQWQNRSLASLQVLQESRRELSTGGEPASGREGSVSPADPIEGMRLPAGRQAVEGAPAVQGTDQASDGARSRPLETAEPPIRSQRMPGGDPLGRSVGGDAAPGSGPQAGSPAGTGDGERARTAEQPWPGGRLAGAAGVQDGISTPLRSDGQHAESAAQPPAAAAGNATDSTAQSQSAAINGSPARVVLNTEAELAQQSGRPNEPGVAGSEPPGWQSGRSSEPLELASSLAGDRLQRFAEQWSSQMNERGARGAARNDGAANPGAPGQAPVSTSMSSESAGSASAPAPQGASAAVPSATPPSGTMPPLPSLTTMPGSSVDAASRNALNPDAALAGSREAFGSGSAGHSAAREQWGEALSQRISLMTARNQSEARVQLDPPELGRLMIQIQVNSDQASVSFTSPHAMVRDALEASVPRLQDMLSEQGLDLLDVDISDQSQQQADDHDEDGRASLAGADEDGPGADEASMPLSGGAGLSLVDDYA